MENNKLLVKDSNDLFTNVVELRARVHLIYNAFNTSNNSYISI